MGTIPRLFRQVIVAALLAAPGLAGAQTAEDAMRLGAVFNTSGSQAVFGKPSRIAADLAVAKINAEGGVLGHPLELSHIDGDSVPVTLSGLVASSLAEDPGIIALFGLADTDLALAAAEAAGAAGRVFLTSGATSPKLPGEVPGSLFLACFGDNVQAAAAAEWAFGVEGLRRVQVLFAPDQTYPVLLKDYFVERFTALGGDILSVDPIAPRAPEPGLPKLGAPDLVFLSVTTAEDAARAIAALRKAGYQGPVLGGDGYDAPQVWAEHPELADIYFTTHVYLGGDSPDPSVAAFAVDFATASGGAEPDAFAALAYDAVGLLAAAITAEGSADPASVAAGLHSMGTFHGLTGEIRYAGDARIPQKSVTLLRVAGGRQHFVAAFVPERIPAP